MLMHEYLSQENSISRLPRPKKQQRTEGESHYQPASTEWSSFLSYTVVEATAISLQRLTSVQGSEELAECLRMFGRVSWGLTMVFEEVQK